MEFTPHFHLPPRWQLMLWSYRDAWIRVKLAQPAWRDIPARVAHLLRH